MLRSLRLKVGEKETLFICAHWKAFPPPGAPAVLAGDTPAIVRAKGLITEDEYQRLQVWERMCGLLAMDSEKCLKCPHLRKVIIKQGQAYIEHPDGRRIPLIEKALLEASAKNRGHLSVGLRPPGSPGSKELAAWVKQANQKPEEP